MFCYKTTLTILSLAVLTASAAATKTFALRGLQAATSPMAERMCNAVSTWGREGGRDGGEGISNIPVGTAGSCLPPHISSF